MLLSRIVSSIAVLLLILLLTPVQAADLQHGLEAYQRGDYASALAEFEPLAEQGDPTAQFSLGVMYDNGEGVVQDYDQAFSWFRQAAEKGHARAQGHLGRMYFLGRGTEEDLVQAYIWFNLAVAQGDDRFGLSQKSRKLAEEKMTPAELEQAQKLSWDYMAKYVEPFRENLTAGGNSNTPADADSADITPIEESASDTSAPEVAVPSSPLSPPATLTSPTQPENPGTAGSNSVPLAIPPLETPTPVSIPSPLPDTTTDTSSGSSTDVANSSSTTSPEEIVPSNETPVIADTSAQTLTSPDAPAQPATIQAPVQPVTPTLAMPNTSSFPRVNTPTLAPPAPSSTEDTSTTTTSTTLRRDADTGNAANEVSSTTTSPTPVATASPPVSTPEPRRSRINTPVQPSPDGRFRVQLASLSSSDKADAEGRRLQSHYSQLLGKLTLTVQSASLDKNVVHRVQMGPLSYSTARSLCRELKRSNQACLVVNR